MCVPTYVNDLLIHFREQLLWAATIYSITTACRLFGLSPKTFFKCKRLKALWEQGGCIGPNPLGYRPPRPQRSNAKPAQARERVLQLKREYPTYGKRRLAAEYIERYQGQIAPNTVQKFLKAERQNLPAPQRRIQYWSFFEALAPHVYWQMDICYAYTAKRHGTAVYFIALLDDHSRAPVAANLYLSQGEREVLRVLADAIGRFGIPLCLIVDHGRQFTSEHFKSVCERLAITLIYCGKGHPQTKGKIERFFRTCRQEHFNLRIFDTLDAARFALQQYLWHYTHERLHATVTDAQGRKHPPSFRLTQMLAGRSRRLPDDVNLDELVQCPEGESAGSRLVKASQRIKYANRWYTLPPDSHLVGQRVEVLLVNGRRDLVVMHQGQVLVSFANLSLIPNGQN